MSWQARLHLNKRVKFYSLFLGNLELVQNTYKYSLLDPGETWKRGLFIQIFASSPRHSSEAGTIHSNIRFFAPVKLRSGDYSFKYLLSRPGGIQKRGLYIQIFAFLPRHSLEVDSTHSLIDIFKYI